jgi:hypothetical protein
MIPPSLKNLEGRINNKGELTPFCLVKPLKETANTLQGNLLPTQAIHLIKN